MKKENTMNWKKFNITFLKDKLTSPSMTQEIKKIVEKKKKVYIPLSYKTMPVSEIYLKLKTT